jgi:hypothetical protein
MAKQIRGRMDDLRRGMKRMARAVQQAAEEAAEHGTIERTISHGVSTNVAAAVNVGRPGRVSGVSVRQRTRTRPDGTTLTETVRTHWGDGAA